MDDKFLFLISCCYEKLSEDDIDFIHTYLSKTTDYQSLISIALKHGILPMVYKTIKYLPRSTSKHTQYFLSELKPVYMQIVQKNIMMSAELLKIMHILEKNHIKALAFKGPVLSQMAYGDITLRQYGDLDILVNPKDLFNAGILFQNNNYTLQGSIDFLNDPLWIEAAKDMILVHEQKNIIIEMHWKLFHSTFAKDSHEVNFWDDIQKIYINEIEVPSLNSNLLLSYLCIHGSRHLWERIEWIVDIDRLIKKNQISWDEVLKYTDLFHSRTMLLLGLSLSHILFGTILPEYLLQMINTKKINRLTHTTLELLVSPLPKEPSTTDIIRRKSIHAAMQDGLHNKIIYWKNVFFQKNYTSILEENKPNSHCSLLDLARPYQLIRKFIFK